MWSQCGFEMKTRLAAASGDFECDVVLGRPEGHESLSVVIPWSDGRFQCTTKDNTRPATGAIRWGGDEWRFGDADRFERQWTEC